MLPLAQVREVEDENAEDAAAIVQEEARQAPAPALPLLPFSELVQQGSSEPEGDHDATDSEAGMSVHTGVESCRWDPSSGSSSRRPSARNSDFDPSFDPWNTGFTAGTNSAHTVERVDGFYGTWYGDDVGIALKTHEDGFLLQFNEPLKRRASDAQEGADLSTVASTAEAAALAGQSPKQQRQRSKLAPSSPGSNDSTEETEGADSANVSPKSESLNVDVQMLAEENDAAATGIAWHTDFLREEESPMNEACRKAEATMCFSSKGAEAEEAADEAGADEILEEAHARRARRPRPLHVPVRTPRGTPIYVPKAAVASAADRGGATKEVHRRRMRLVSMYNAGPSAIASAPLLPGIQGRV